jgi:hypothetical protein
MQSDEERRAKNAAKQRAFRARKAAERAAAKAAAGDGGDAATTMRDAVESALAAMKWLTDSDVASKAQARLLAEQVDVLGHRGDTIRMLSAHRALSQVLSDLAGTPKVRLQHELRSARVTAKQGGDDVGNEGEAAGNVSAFKRPQKRARV